MTVYHKPVLLQQCIEALKIDPDGIYVDATFGGGGHSWEILRQLSTKGRLIGFDQDAASAQNCIQDEKFQFVQHNFRYMKNFLRYMGIEKINGLVADLGVSWHQFDTPSRGFSFRFDETLDMRMNTGATLTAAAILNTAGSNELKEIFRNYGELRQAGKITSLIEQMRAITPINTAGQLVECLKPVTPRAAENKFLAQVFQALRIAVNHELTALKDLLIQAAEMIIPGGRMVIISYHSLEDKLVKNYIRYGQFDGQPEKDLYGNVSVPFSPVFTKPIVPDDREISRNSRARSAKMRAAQHN